MRVLTLGPFSASGQGNNQNIIAVRLVDFLPNTRDPLDDDFSAGLFVRAAAVTSLSAVWRGALDNSDGSMGAIISNTLGTPLNTFSTLPFYGTLQRKVPWLLLRTAATGNTYTDMYITLVI